MKAIQVVTTTASQQEAAMIASALLEQRLAACVQISGPINSMYRWQGEIKSSQEWVCTIKTIESRYEAIEAAIRDLHSYDEPEILATRIVAGSSTYLAWLTAEIE